MRVKRVIQFYEFEDGTWDATCSWLGAPDSGDVRVSNVSSWEEAHEKLVREIERAEE